MTFCQGKDFKFFIPLAVIDQWKLKSCNMADGPREIADGTCEIDGVLVTKLGLKH